MDIIDKIENYQNEGIPPSTAYKLVNADTYVIEFAGSKKDMLRLLKKKKAEGKKYFLGLTNKAIGEKFPKMQEKGPGLFVAAGERGGVNECYVVVDNPRNRVNFPEVIGKTFENKPPLYIQSEPSNKPAQYKDLQDYFDKHGKVKKESSRGPDDTVQSGLEHSMAPDGQM